MRIVERLAEAIRSGDALTAKPSDVIQAYDKLWREARGELEAATDQSYQEGYAAGRRDAESGRS